MKNAFFENRAPEIPEAADKSPGWHFSQYLRHAWVGMDPASVDELDALPPLEFRLVGRFGPLASRTLSHRLNLLCVRVAVIAPF
jgi:hypothetical protein